MLDLIDRVGLSSTQLTDLRSQLAGIETLEDVVRWGLEASPPRDIVEVVTQDEYTHDVILFCRDQTHLVFDAT